MKTILGLISILFLLSKICFSQTGAIEGKILDENLHQAIGTNVINKSTKDQTIADENGNYKINASKGDTLAFQYIGFTTEIRVVEKENEKLNIILMDKDVNCLGAVWSQRDYKKAYRRIEKQYRKLYAEAEEKKKWNENTR